MCDHLLQPMSLLKHFSQYGFFSLGTKFGRADDVKVNFDCCCLVILALAWFALAFVCERMLAQIIDHDDDGDALLSLLHL